MALGTNLKFHISAVNGLKLNVRRFLGLNLTFVEVMGKTGKGWGGGGGRNFWSPS